MKRFLMASVLGCSVLSVVGCGSEESSQEASAASQEHENVVLTTFYPTAYFARRISGGLVPVDCPVPEGEDPIFWQPGREALERYRNAKLIVLNGAQFEKWAIHASLPSSRIVNSAGAFKSEFIRYDTGITHSHGAAGEHSHEGIDGHTWLDPIRAITQAEAIAEGMSEAWPEHADAFATNLAELARDLTELDNAFKAMTPKLEGVKLLASHPAYNYLADRYGWSITNLDLDPDEGVSAEAMEEIAAAIGNHEGRTILLWESEPSDSGFVGSFTNVYFSPAELPGTGPEPLSPDYLEIMQANIQRLESALDQ
ncbi:MAG: metal ABC transporter substrate-binding protein [Phycisphaerales bacterium JB061]